jgi:tripartite-type tricarboxylate transporter receptor subunit TctC
VFVPFVWTAHPSTPGSNLRETMAFLQKERGARYSYGSTGPGSTMHILGEALAREAKVEMTHIPFKGAAPLKQELIAGRVNLGGDQLSSSLGDIKAGRLKALATSASRRIAELPDVPTVRELGYAVLEADGWNGFFAPAKTPREVLERLNKEVVAAVRHPEVAKRLRDMAAEPVGSSGAEQEAILKRQMDQFRPIIQQVRVE